MEYTTFKITTESRDKLKKFSKEYNKKSVSDFMIFLLDYLEKNKIDLNVDLYKQTISSLDKLDKNTQTNFDNVEKKLKTTMNK